MKRHIKLFEEFINEEDPLAALGLGGEEKDEKPKEDPLEKQKKAEKAKEKKAKEKHEEYVEKKQDKIEDILDELPEVEEALGNKIKKAVNDQDRVKIHDVFLDVIYLQQKYQESGDDKMIAKLTPLKKYLEELDRSYTSDKRM